MTRVALKSLLAHKLRLFLSGFAVVLGVAFVAGSFIFTDTLDKAFTSIVSGTQPDVVVRPESALGASAIVAGATSTQTLPGSLVASLREVDGVARADGDVQAPYSVFVLDKDGKVIGGQGAPGVATNLTGAPAANGDPVVTITAGRAPRALGEVMLDDATYEKAGLGLGDTVRMVSTGDPARLEATLVGSARFGETNSLAGASLLLFDTRAAQQLFLGGADAYTTVSVTTGQGAGATAVTERIREVLPPGVEAQTGKVLADEAVQALSTVLRFINIFLLTFAFVAVFVGIYLIVNTFSILVAQRIRELALLRALGASRRQVTRTVLVEALVVGVAASATGLLLGFGLALGIKALFGLIGLELTGASLVFQWRTALVAFLVGVPVTMLAAYFPARRAAKVPPVAAMRDDVAIPQSSLRVRAAGGVVLLLLGAAALGAGLAGFGSGTTTATLVGAGAVAVLLGVTALGPVVGPPIVAVVAAGFPRLFGTVGRMARENARRNPRRTAATASALMIGLTLVTAFSVLGSSTQRSVAGIVQTDLTADYVVSNVTQQPFSAAIGDEIAAVDGVAQVARFRAAFAKVDGQDDFIAALEPSTFDRAVRVTMTDGALTDLREGTLMVSDDRATSKGWAVGDTVAVTLPAGTQSLRVGGVFESSQFLASVVLPFAALEQGGVPVADTIAYVSAEPGSDAAAVRADVEQVVADLPLVSVQDGAEFADSQAGQVDTLLSLIYALLGLAIVIAILGIVNTLALSVIERTREIGLLRAVGMRRRQLRQMIRLEAVATAVLGAVLGIVLGLVFGVALQRALRDQGLEQLGVPYGRIALFFVLAIVVGVLAAIWPARRAARLDVLKAITTE